MKIKCFGIVKDIVGADMLPADGLSPKTVGDLRAELLKKYPELKGLTQFMIAVNLEYASDDHALGADDEIAIIPPVSGG